MAWRIITSTEIYAPRALAWDILTDFAKYPEWNPYIAELRGELAPGQPVTVTTPPLLPFTAPRVFRPIVLDVEPGIAFGWVGLIGSPRMFRGEHHFRLQALGRDRTRLVHGERFEGLIAPLHRVSRYYATRAGFERMNAALKRRVESFARDRAGQIGPAL